MKKTLYIFILLTFPLILFSCKSIEVISISQQQTKVSQVRNYILNKSINNLSTTSFNNLSMDEIMGEAYSYLDLQRNELPYLNDNLNTFTIKIHSAYIKSLFESKDILINYSQKLDYPLIYPNVENRYIINQRSSSFLLNTYRDELYLEIDNLLDENLKEVASLYNSMANEYNIYCRGLENLNRPSPQTVATNILPRLKTVFIKILINDLIQNEIDLGLLNTPIDPTIIDII